MNKTFNAIIYFRCRMCGKPMRRNRFIWTVVCGDECWHAMIHRYYPDYYKQQEQRRKVAQWWDNSWNYGVALSQGWEP